MWILLWVNLRDGSRRVSSNLWPLARQRAPLFARPPSRPIGTASSFRAVFVLNPSTAWTAISLTFLKHVFSVMFQCFILIHRHSSGGSAADRWRRPRFKAPNSRGVANALQEPRLNGSDAKSEKCKQLGGRHNGGGCFCTSRRNDGKSCFYCNCARKGIAVPGNDQQRQRRLLY